VATAPISPFDDATVAAVAMAIADLYSGSELTRLLGAAQLTDPQGEGATTWKRLYDAVAYHQNRHSNGKATITLIVAARAQRHEIFGLL
jgi:hypothetical protein